jgi:D-lactate dehydrogenase
LNINPGFQNVPFKFNLRHYNLVSLHLPLTPGTFHMIDDAAIEKMKPGLTLINTGRGGLVDSAAVRR